MRAGWSQVVLSEVAAINPRPTDRPSDDQPVEFVSMADLLSTEARTRTGVPRPFSEVATGYSHFRRGDVLVAKITPCFENGKIGRATIRTELGAGSTEFHVVRPNTSLLDASYALHFLRRSEVRKQGILRMTGSAGQRRVPESFLSALKLPLPPLDEQRRIARVLDSADQIRTRRRASHEMTERLRASVFSAMTVHADEDWPTVEVAELASSSNGGIRTGPFGSQLLHGEFVDEGVAVLGIDNAVNNRFEWGADRFITEQKYRALRRYTVHPGDVLITIMGTCGRAAIVPDGIGVAINTKHLCCVSLNRSECLPSYLHGYFLRDPSARRYLKQRAKGAIMSGLNMGIIKEMPIRLPPIGVQQELAERLAEIDALDARHRSHQQQLDALFDSLQHRAFTGTL